ncbi:glycosyltransferase [Pontiella sulfatireligans]|uniref:N-acetyl-alpha-D-glucosaminyl L-malate synthase n=1 Tax=Pontiella sulfatireligans TaxID=2750658 RepID=A0A6C2UL67_9BACT|nr:glycosyltransferase [Pontiella sulfatireligans]VGO20982.1 N-acetyl-alpha-D-glucosaminyl L-malate synthase [Pontiella sulfatireligans]
MKITQIMLGKGFGGAERSFVDTALALAARGHEVQAICHRDFVKRGLLENVPGLTLETIKAGGEYDFMAPRRIANLIRAFEPSIVHTQLKRAAWHGGRGAHRAGVPVVSKLHNYVKLERYRYVHTLIGTTEDQRRHALKLNWPEDRVTVIPNFSRVPPVAEARTPEARPLRLLTYGRCVHKKGFDVLLQALKKLIDGGVEAELLIGGSGPELDALQALSVKLGLAGRVNLGVWIDDVGQALDEADVFVLPSRDEPFGIVMLEAMARGLPIVTTRTQGPVQVLTDETAYFADIDSVETLVAGLRQAAAHPEDARQKAAAALELYRTTYHEDAVLPRFEALYESVSSR